MMIRGLIDLRAYAAKAAPAQDWIAGRAPPAYSDALASVAAIAPVGQGVVALLRADEFVMVLQGELSLETKRSVTTLGAGRSAVLPAGITFEWRAGAGTVLVIVSCPAPAGTAPDVVVVDENAPLRPSSPPLAQLLVGPTPSCRNHDDYESANGELSVGTWDSTPYQRRAMTYRHIELMHLLEGAVTFADGAGSVTFTRGDVILATRGTHAAWISEVPVKKVYSIHRPA